MHARSREVTSLSPINTVSLCGSEFATLVLASCSGRADLLRRPNSHSELVPSRRGRSRWPCPPEMTTQRAVFGRPNEVQEGTPTTEGKPPEENESCRQAADVVDEKWPDDRVRQKAKVERAYCHQDQKHRAKVFVQLLAAMLGASGLDEPWRLRGSGSGRRRTRFSCGSDVKQQTGKRQRHADDRQNDRGKPVHHDNRLRSADLAVFRELVQSNATPALDDSWQHERPREHPRDRTEYRICPLSSAAVRVQHDYALVGHQKYETDGWGKYSSCVSRSHKSALHVANGHSH